MTLPQRRYRVAFVNTHPIQYFAPLYAHLTRRGGIDAVALYLSDLSLRGARDRGFGQPVTWDIDLLDGYEARFMGPTARKRRLGGYVSMTAPELWPEIRNGGFDAVVVHGHYLAAHAVALAAARSARVPVFARGESHPGLRRPAWKRAIRAPVLKAWLSAFDGVLAIGSANRREYAAFGVPADRIHHMPYAVDTARFAKASTLDRAALRKRFGVRPDAPAILYAAKFEPRKRPLDLLAAHARLRASGVDASLVFAGSGALEAELRAGAAGSPDVVFPGFVNQAELPELYAACDVFVLPSEDEPWGLVVNEAMSVGLPVVVSRGVGCADDLVAPGVNGAVFETGDVDGLAAALRPLLQDTDFRRRFGAASRARIEGWSFEAAAAGLRRAVAAARTRRGLEPAAA